MVLGLSHLVCGVLFLRDYGSERFGCFIKSVDIVVSRIVAGFLFEPSNDGSTDGD